MVFTNGTLTPVVLREATLNKLWLFPIYLRIYQLALNNFRHFPAQNHWAQQNNNSNNNNNNNNNILLLLLLLLLLLFLA